MAFNGICCVIFSRNLLFISRMTPPLILSFTSRFFFLLTWSVSFLEQLNRRLSCESKIFPFISKIFYVEWNLVAWEEGKSSSTCLPLRLLPIWSTGFINYLSLHLLLGEKAEGDMGVLRHFLRTLEKLRKFINRKVFPQSSTIRRDNLFLQWFTWFFPWLFIEKFPASRAWTMMLGVQLLRTIFRLSVQLCSERLPNCFSRLVDLVVFSIISPLARTFISNFRSRSSFGHM